MKKILASSLILISFFFFISSSYAEIRIFFSPEGGIAEEIIKQINSAQEYIDIAIYSFTYEPIAEAIIRAKQRGVKIRVLMDKGQSQGKSSKYEFLLDNDIAIIQDRHVGIMHNKIAIIDGRVLFTGSYDWSESAEERNEENLLEFIDEGEIIEIYRERLDYLWGQNAPKERKPRFYEEVLEMQTVLQLVQIVTLVILVVYVIKTWHMASATRQMAEASRGTLEGMKESRDILTRPYVNVYFDSSPGQSWFELVIENTGSGSARNVNLKFDPPLRTSRENLMDLEIFKKGISFLPPHQKIKLFFDIGFSYFKKDLPMKYQVEVIYRGGLEDVLRRENYVLDLSIYKNLRSIRRKGIHELVEVMDKVLKQIQKQQKSQG